MYGLPKETDLTILVNCELIQVCVGLHQVILRFQNETSITLECAYSVNHQRRDGGMTIQDLLGHLIVKAFNHGEGRLELAFSNGAVLEFADTNPHHESFTISSPERYLVV